MCEKDDRKIVTTKDGHKIEVTSDMIHAGAEALYDFDPDWDDWSEAIYDVFKKMINLSNLSIQNKTDIG